MTSVELPMTAGDRGDAAENIGLIAVRVDDNPEACDAMMLATTIARAAGAKMMLVTVYPDLPPPVLPKIG